MPEDSKKGQAIIPELPEVEAITGVARRHAAGNNLTGIEIIRWNGKYFNSPSGPLFPNRGWDVSDVCRIGKHIVFRLPHPDPSLWESYLIVHNAMSGYFDWEHEPWTFDYVEGPRDPSGSDVRVRLLFGDGKVLRFHDSRLFGRMRISGELPITGPELLQTAHAFPGLPVITLPQFAARIRATRRPIKSLLMDQSFVAGIGNIYANEACHLAAINPHLPAHLVPPATIPNLLEALRCAVLHSIPQVRYQWLNVYRRSVCGSCGRPVVRTEIDKRATFHCERCQTL